MKEKINTDNNSNLYTIKEVSDLTGISETVLIRFVMLKKINTLRIGKSIRITEQELDRLIKNLSGKRESRGETILFEEKNAPVIYTAEEIAEILNLSVDNVWLLLKSGELKGFKIRQGRSSWRIPERYLNEFIEKRIIKTGTEEI